MNIIHLLFTFSVIFTFSISSANAQIVVGLDHYYNHETHSETGKPFHYLWTDTENSGYSQWGDLFKAQGAALTLIEKPSTNNLKKTNVYIIVDPDTTTENPDPNYMTDKDAKAIAQWVEAGGVLLLMSNDAPNAEFTHFNVLAEKFGLHFNPVSLLPVTGQNWDMGAITEFPNHPIFKDVPKIYMKEVSSIVLSGKATPVLEKDGNALMAEVSYGKGHVLAIGDPWIYNEYIGHKFLPESFANHQAAENLTSYLLSLVNQQNK